MRKNVCKSFKEVFVFLTVFWMCAKKPRSKYPFCVLLWLLNVHCSILISPLIESHCWHSLVNQANVKVWIRMELPKNEEKKRYNNNNNNNKKTAFWYLYTCLPLPANQIKYIRLGAEYRLLSVTFAVLIRKWACLRHLFDKSLRCYHMKLMLSWEIVQSCYKSRNTCVCCDTSMYLYDFIWIWQWKWKWMNRT